MIPDEAGISSAATRGRDERLLGSGFVMLDLPAISWN